MWQATRKAAELIKLVTYCNTMNANLSCTQPHAQKNNKKNIFKKMQNIAESYKKANEKPTSSSQCSTLVRNTVTL